MERSNRVADAFPNPAFNAFLMMRFAPDGSDREIVDLIRAGFSRYAIDVLRADDRSFCDSLWENVRSYMDACHYGVAVFEERTNVHFNPNVSLEVGYMIARERRVLLLKERSLPQLHSDLVGHLYKTFDKNDLGASINAAVGSWLQDVGVAKSRAEKLVVFVSYGGTCRCAMSKIIAYKAFDGRRLPFPIRFQSVAFRYGNNTRASDGARQAIREEYGEDLLEDHRVMKQNPGIIEDADLILVMGHDLAQGFPPQKTHVIKEFFGGSGRVANPYKNGGEYSESYRQCFLELRSIIEPNVERLISSLEST